MSFKRKLWASVLLRFTRRYAVFAMGAAFFFAGPSWAAADCLRSTDALRSVLALPGAAKSGQVYCLAPGRYMDLRPGDFAGAFADIHPARPVTFEAQDPNRPPVLNMWLAGDRAPGGNFILRNLAFDLTDLAEVPYGESGFRSGQRVAVQLGRRHPVENITVDGIRVIGPLREARLGGRETARIPVGIMVNRGRNVVVRDNRFERVLNGMIVSGTDIEIVGNRMRHSWGDLARVVPQTIPGGQDCAATQRVTLRNNVLSDLWGNNRMHPDMLQMFAANKVSCDVRDLLIEGNIAYPGTSGMLSRPYVTGMQETVPKIPPAQLPAGTRQIHRLIGPGQIQLPTNGCGTERAENHKQRFAVQRDPSSTGSLVLVPAPGDRLRVGERDVSHLALDAPWETWRFQCDNTEPGRWWVQRSVPSMQGVFTNRLPQDAGYHNITIRHNIIWAQSPAGVGFSDPQQSQISVLRNSILRPWPGDLTGDGRANTGDDGFNTAFAIGRIIVNGGDRHRIEGNVAHHHLDGATGVNDVAMRRGDGGASMVERFAAGPGPRLMPQSLSQAVALARPKPGGALDGVGLGALGVTAAQDPYDWSWTAEPW